MSRLLNFRVSEEQEAVIRKHAKIAGLSLSDYVRERALFSETVPKWIDPPPIEKGRIDSEGAPATVEPKDIDASRDFKERVNYFKNARGMTTKRAEEAARREAA